MSWVKLYTLYVYLTAKLNVHTGTDSFKLSLSAVLCWQWCHTMSPCSFLLYVLSHEESLSILGSFSVSIMCFHMPMVSCYFCDGVSFKIYHQINVLKQKLILTLIPFWNIRNIPNIVLPKSEVHRSDGRTCLFMVIRVPLSLSKTSLVEIPGWCHQKT